MFVTLTILSFELTFWLFNGFLIFIEQEHVTFFDKYRNQKDKPKVNFVRQPDLVHKIISLTIKQQISLILLTPILYYLLNLRGKLIILEEIPSYSTVAWHLFIFIISEDALFFWSHYLLHTPFLMRTVHSKHHEFKQPVGVTSLLSHPIESFLGNNLPVFLMPILLKEKHLFTILIWISLRVLQTVNAHCGYDFPFFNPRIWLPGLHGGSLFHDYHHKYGKDNYGSFFTLWDRLMGTYRSLETSN